MKITSWLSSWATTLRIMIFERRTYHALREAIDAPPEDFTEVSGLVWYPAQSADQDHPNEEIDLDAIGNPAGARWAHVADEGTGGPYRWYIYARWLWDDIDADEHALLASGPATSMDEGKQAVADWLSAHGREAP
jgi:hypothetical protein